MSKPSHRHNAICCFERRAIVRYSCAGQVSGERVAGETTHVFEGRILDLSINGVGLGLQRKLANGTRVSLTLKHATGNFRCDRSAVVIHARPTGDMWIVGCEFTEPLTSDELSRFRTHERPDMLDMLETMNKLA